MKKFLTHSVGWLLIYVIFFCVHEARAEDLQLTIESVQHAFPIDALSISVTLSLHNTGAAPIRPYEIFNDSQIIINDRAFPIYMTWNGAEGSSIAPGEIYSRELNLTFYEPFQVPARNTLIWKYKDIVSAPFFLEITEEKPPPSPPPAPVAEVPAQTQREISKVYYEGGELFSETDLFSDVNNGFYRTYHRNGQLQSEVRYKNGWQIYDKAFDEAGRPLFRNGPVNNYYGGGNVLSDIVNYKNDKKDGIGTYYYYDGRTVVDVWHYMDGVQVGIHTRNDQSGQLRYREDWGYPTYYVIRLRKMIAVLSAVVAILLVGMIGLIIRGRHRQ